ncbi:MAG: hypothetical protein JNL35_09520 [Sphingopyxis sp.]|nr:hypothetical protein [Sphingopyxis sp.]
MEDEIGAGPVGPLQRRKPRANGWTMARRKAFLEELAESCNVERARKAAGMGSGGVYRLRQRDPLFAEQWQAALMLGYERLEMALLRRAIEAVEGLTLDAADEARQPVEKMSVAEAMAVLRQHRASVEGGTARRLRPMARQAATQQEVDAIVIQRIRMVKRRRLLRHRDGSAVALPQPPPQPRGGA